MRTFLLVILLAFLLFFCTEDKNKLIEEIEISDWTPRGDLIVEYPLDSTIFPPEYPPPSFIWTDHLSKSWRIYLSINDTREAVSGKITDSRWQPDSVLWQRVKSESYENNISFFIAGVNENEDSIVALKSFSIRTVKDSVGAPIFFRSVPLPMSVSITSLDKFEWYLADISSSQSPKKLFSGYILCANCHSFSSDGEIMGMEIDYARKEGHYFFGNRKSKGSDNKSISTIIKPNEIYSFEKIGKKSTFAEFSQVSPCGRFVLTTGNSRMVFSLLTDDYYSKAFFPIKGVIAVYDRITNKYYELPGANKTDFVQSNPIWSPDGKEILFVRAKYEKNVDVEKAEKALISESIAFSYISGEKSIKYDIYRIPFNQGKGGQAEPLAGASNNGKSNYFPKYSPDGKWIVFCQSASMMSLQPDSRLFIVPANGGTPRDMECNTSRMNSWHSFSPNSRWMVFSTKRFNPFTQLFMTYIDENGKSSPPVWLEYFRQPSAASNLPEFINIKYDDWQAISTDFLHQDHYAELRALTKGKLGAFSDAIEDFDKAIEQDPGNFKKIGDRAFMKLKTGDYEGALFDFNKAIALNSKDHQLFYARAYTYIELGNNRKALDDLSKAIKLKPDFVKAIYERGLLYFNMKEYNNSIKDYEKALEYAPNNYYAYLGRGLCLIELGDKNAACRDFKKAYQLGCMEAVEALEAYCE